MVARWVRQRHQRYCKGLGSVERGFLRFHRSHVVDLEGVERMDDQGDQDDQDDRRRPPVLAAGRRWRLLRVYRTAAVVLLAYGFFALRRRLHGAEWAVAELPRVHRRNARRILATVLAVQGLFIKVGQLVSLLSSVLPADFRGELAVLQDRIPPRPWEEVHRRLAAELGDPEARFASIEHGAVAAASLAQVHVATLHDGRRVAVKVQHLGVERLARLDLATVRRILAIAGFFTGARGLGRALRRGPGADPRRAGLHRRGRPPGGDRRRLHGGRPPALPARWCASSPPAGCW